jgi:hypothetical protein
MKMEILLRVLIKQLLVINLLISLAREHQKLIAPMPTPLTGTAMAFMQVVLNLQLPQTMLNILSGKMVIQIMKIELVTL